MGDAVTLSSELELVHRTRGQNRRMHFEQPHARGRVGKAPARIDALRIDRAIFRIVTRSEAGKAMIDPVAFDEARENRRAAIVAV